MNNNLTEDTPAYPFPRLSNTYFLESQGINVNDDFTFLSDDGKVCFIAHNGDIIMDEHQYEFIDWLEINFKSNRSAIVKTLSIFMHLTKRGKQ